MTKKGARAAAAAAAAAAATTTTTTGEGEGETEEKKQSNHAKRKYEERQKDAKIDPLLDSQFAAGRLYAAISSRPGQSGRADGYILEGKELEVRVSGVMSNMGAYGDPSFTLVLPEEVEVDEAKTCSVSCWRRNVTAVGFGLDGILRCCLQHPFFILLANHSFLP